MVRTYARALYWQVMNTWWAIRRFRGARIDSSVQWRGRGAVVVRPGAYVGARTVVDSGVDGTVCIGDKVWIGADCEISSMRAIEIGAHTTLQHRTQLHGDVQVGAGCTGAAGLYVSSGWHEFRHQAPLPIRLQDRVKAAWPTDWRSRPVSIGDDCWLGVGVVIMPGVTVGRGCVIGANSVVTRDLAPYTIAAGAPAQLIGRRLDFVPPDTIHALEDAHVPYFYAGFSQIGAREDAVAPRRVRDGFPVARAFTVASQATPGAVIMLSVNSLSSGVLRHGHQKQAIVAGVATSIWSASPVRPGLLQFQWEPTDVDGLDDALVVTSFSRETGPRLP